MSDIKDDTPLPLLRFAEVCGEYVGCVKPYCLIRREDKEMISPRAFNMEYNRLVNVCEGLGTGKPSPYRDDAAGAAINSPALEVARTICYRPDGDAIIGRKFNMWSDPQIDPLEGEPTIFLEHINYLIPAERERQLLLQWLAWLVQHPDEKVMWALLMIGRGGTGKSWLGKLMERIFGRDNVVLISEEDVVTSTFNGFSENKRLVFLHETPPEQMAELLDKVKGLITESDIHINRKGIERYKAENLANLMAVSNKPVKIDLTNRRWAVIRAADDAVGADMRGQPTQAHRDYYKRLWDVVPPDGRVTDEARRVLRYLKTYPLKKFDRLVAPITEAKAEAAETGDGLYSRIADAYANGKGPFRFTLLTAEEVARHFSTTADRTLTEHMTEVGCRSIRRPDGKAAQVTFDDGKRPRLWAINPKVAASHGNTPVAELARLYAEERSKPTLKATAATPSYARPAPPPDVADDDGPADWELDDGRTLN